ncbi:GGDEF domain-containing protein [Rhizobium sp. GR12]|uniref:GGDEF domain-containing protein n=1 Tax=Rhizobium sp. GR12 TaxID=3053925 RepID=UPI002FBDA419
MFPLRKWFDYLAGSPLTGGADCNDELLQDILDRRWEIILGAACIAMTASVAAYITKEAWPIFWLGLEVVLTAAKWIVISHALTGASAVRRRSRSILAFLILVWSGVFGIVMHCLVQADDQGLLVVACVMTVGVSSALTNAAMPRTAILAICLITFPFFTAIALSLAEHNWMAFVAGIPLLASLYSLTQRNHGALVRLIAAERQARALAHTDALTGLPNRLSFLSYQDNIAAHNAGKGGYAYMCLDLDGFKLVNDKHGHAAGDLLLKAVAERLQQNTRVGDIAFRIGGDEFIVYMPNAVPAECASVANRVIECMAFPFMLSEELVVTIGCSAGSACVADTTKAASLILKAADKALYKAKENGKSRHVHAAEIDRTPADP